MPYIYKITNKKNGKIYIGKTLSTIEKRWRRHCLDYIKKHYEKRPLYSAMNKYGIDCFTIEEVEECSENILSEREKYWIEYYGSFKNGYNATVGGDGKQYIDYDLVVATYYQVKNQSETAKILGIDVSTVRRILKIRNVDKYSSGRTEEFLQRSIAINMFSKDGKYIKSYPSAHEAARCVVSDPLNQVIHGAAGHILDVCKGKRKSAYGYIWEYANI